MGEDDFQIWVSLVVYKFEFSLEETQIWVSSPKKREIQQLASSYTFDNEFKDFMKIYKGYTKEPHYFLAWTMQLCHQIIQYDLGRNYYKKYS